ncbi:hypothetical protein [Dysgonomonas sp. 521]|uniref:hypothetical protein n=1 Tax=Dysgonomonas sp. 521 TaxID=2302932 RepID=UPI0013CF43B6|nr:hypothetical protein [Dysgonomonas sp. 521]
MFNEEQIRKYEEIFKKNNIEFTDEKELKSVLNQMYMYAQITYEQFRMNKKEK